LKTIGSTGRIGSPGLSQLFRHLNIQSDLEYNLLYRYSSVQPGVRDMIEHCFTMFDIRKRQTNEEKKNSDEDILVDKWESSYADLNESK
jgi:hypothetical protein